MDDSEELYGNSEDESKFPRVPFVLPEEISEPTSVFDVPGEKIEAVSLFDQFDLNGPIQTPDAPSPFSFYLSNFSEWINEPMTEEERKAISDKEYALEAISELEDELAQLTLELGPTYPIERHSRYTNYLPACEFSNLYPEIKTLTHYTTAAGLQGIMDSHTLWATNLAFLNDPEEFLFAHRRFVSLAEKGDLALDNKYLAYFMEGLEHKVEERQLIRTYIISFSARSDDLSQFRAYSDNTRGYALEFDAVKIMDALNYYLRHSEAEFFTLRRVRYGEAELESFHNRVLEAVGNCILRWSSQPESDVHEALFNMGSSCGEYLRQAGLVFKQDGFRNEEEYRIVLDVPGKSGLSHNLAERIKVRFRGALPVPYIPFPFMDTPRKVGHHFVSENGAGLKRILVGPGIDFMLADTGLFYFLRNCGMQRSVEVAPSRSSYRTT